MQDAFSRENEFMDRACAELDSHGELSSDLRDQLKESLGERFANGWELAISGKVRKYEFAPSGRVVWAVQGRKSEYQVMPDIPFCYCDDYYFRVMDRKRGLCYHIIAQRIASSLRRFEHVSARDTQYSAVTSRWRAKEDNRR